jgi:phenylacetate-CoA ligase
MNPLLIRKVIYPLYRAVKRDLVLAGLAEMRRVEKMDRDEIREFQWRKLRPLLEHAAEFVPYYSRILKGLGVSVRDLRSPEDLKYLPLLHKKDIRENLEQLISRTYSRKDLRRDETGGSTGENLFFYTDRASSEAQIANTVRMNDWIGIKVGDRTAYLWGIRFRQSRRGRIVKSIKNWLSNTIVLSTYTMDERSIDAYSRRLGRFKPALVIGYPSALSHFSQMITGGGLDGFRPKAILTSGETLYEWQRSTIEGAIEAPVFDHYGCCEFGAVARECRYHDGLHIACDRVLIETLPVASLPSGEKMHELVITDLDNYGMPFIRYAIEDLGHLTWDKCRCGIALPRLQSLAGRVYDVVRAPNGNYLGGTFWGHILKEGVEKFQVIQENLNEVRISVVPTNGFGDLAKRQAVEKVQEACGPEMKVTFVLTDRLDATPTGKHRYVISKIGLKGNSGGRPSAAQSGDD